MRNWRTKPRGRGRRWLCAWFGAICALLAAPAQAAPITVEATVESNDVIVGEPFALTIKVDGAQNVETPPLEGLDGFRADYLGPSTQVSFVNGQVSSSISHRYRLIAERPGEFTIGPFTVEYGGQRYQTGTIPLRVAAAPQRRQVAAPGGAQNLRLVVTPAKAEVYVGERVDLAVTLYVGNIRIRELQYPVFSTDGVTVGKFGKPEEGSEVVGGRRYQVVRLRTTMTPVRAGPIDLQATMAMQVLTNRRGGDPFFEQFFGGEAKPVELRSDPVQLNVLALPDAGRPADFSGAVGQFDFNLTANPTELNAGDPVTVRMEISGRGDLATVSPPPIPVGNQFRRYDPQPVKGEDSAERRVFEQVVIPNAAGIAALPAAAFSYFDPEARTYRTITRGPVPLTVRAAAAGKAQVLDAAPAAPAAPAAQPLGRDIVYIKDAPGALRSRGAALYQRSWFVVLQLLPPLLFAGAWAYVRRRERLAADPRLVRFRQAGREARRALAALQAQAAGDPTFYDALSAALAAYLGAKLDLPPGAVERDRVAARLTANGCGATVGERAGALFDVIERARYAPSGDAAAERATVLRLAGELIDGLERARGLDRRIAAGIAFVLIGVASMAAGVRGEEATPQTAFFAGNQAYAGGNYDAAIRAYDSVLASGQESGGLFFNLGNAFFKDGQLGRAIASYERARRLLPRDPDVQANLQYAREQAGVEQAERPLWKRLAFPFATRANGTELAVLASLCWVALWVVLTVRLLVPRLRVGLGRAAAVAAACYLALAGSLGLRLAELELRDAAVVTAAGETQVRFEPSPTGTEHFPVAAGTTLDVTEERDGWLQVRRDDGRRGWIPAGAVERL
jgi:tetratricopeptide (TPR) repeat protein